MGQNEIGREIWCGWVVCVGEQTRYFTFMYFEGFAAKSVVCNYIPDKTNLYLPFIFGSWTPRLNAAVNLAGYTELNLVIWRGGRRAYLTAYLMLLSIVCHYIRDSSSGYCKRFKYHLFSLAVIWIKLLGVVENLPLVDINGENPVYKCSTPVTSWVSYIYILWSVNDILNYVFSYALYVTLIDPNWVYP